MVDIRTAMENFSDWIGEWQGVPVPVDGFRVRLHPGHPLAAKVAEMERILDPPALSERACDDGEGRLQLVNTWFSYERNLRVSLVRDLATGKTLLLKEPVSPDQSMARLTYWLTTLGASRAWTVRAEAKAMEKLAGLLSESQLNQYFLTGSFIETSQRSQVSYLFRRLRPTVAMTSRNKDPRNDSMRCLAVLCMHPIGYYAETWAGCMAPSDDVIAHLMMMRGDEPGFWRQANQHRAWAPEAGL